MSIGGTPNKSLRIRAKITSRFGIVLWGGPPGLRPAPWPASWDSAATRDRPARGPAADQGVRPTTTQHQA